MSQSVDESCEHEDRVVQCLTECQSRLFAYIYSLTTDPELAWDILQETNRVLWRKANEFDSTRDFAPWAMTHAFNQVRAARKRAQRERLVFQDEGTLQGIADDWKSSQEKYSAENSVALEDCLNRLSERHRRLVDQAYSEGKSFRQIGEAIGRTENAVAVSLHRIRQALAECIRARFTVK